MEMILAKDKMIRIFTVYLYTTLILLLSCRKTNDFVAPTKPNEQQVTLRLLMPQQGGKMSTYAIGEVNQNSIYTLDVLAFKVADDGREHYAYHKRAVLLSPNEEATAVNFHVDLPKSTDNFRFVLVANAAAQLQTALSGLAANAEKETLLSRIEYSISTKWNAASPASFTPLPMWGESVVVAGINSNTQKFSVAMLRSLAAIDVKVSASDFVMTQVYVYNMANKGRVSPIPANYRTDEHRVTAPSIPTGTLRLAAQQYTPGPGGLAGEIFLFESQAPTNTGEPTATALVIAGKYAGSNTVTYYRVELTDNQDKLLPILRNHRYVVDITKVHGAGLSTPDQASTSKPLDMTVQVTDWTNADLSEGNMPLQYLRVSTTKAELSGFQGEMTFTVWTNAPTVNLVLPNWLLNLETDRLGDKITYRFFVNENNSAIAKRTAKINVQVGRLTGTVNVTQGAKPIDLGPGYNFYVFARDLNETVFFWYIAANVEKGNISLLDASLTQKTGEPYPLSCVAKLGPGARLPTIQELRQLIPNDQAEHDAVNAAIKALGGNPMPVDINSLTYFLSSTSESLNTFKGIYGKTRLDFTMAKFPTNGLANLIGRCVLSK